MTLRQLNVSNRRDNATSKSASLLMTASNSVELAKKTKIIQNFSMDFMEIPLYTLSTKSDAL